MPFTLAHPLAVVPLLAARWRWLDATALIAGSMAPDFEYFLRAEMRGGFSHTAAGLLAFDVPMALALGLLFHRLLQVPLWLALPGPVRLRLPAPAPAAGPAAWPGPWAPRWAVIVLSALVGAATHLAWDALTHRTGWVVERTPLLASVVQAPLLGDVAVYRTLQHASTVVGLAGLALLLSRRRPRPADAPPEALVRRARRALAVATGGGAVLMILARAWLNGGLPWAHVGHAIAAGIAGALLGLVVASLVLRPAARRFRRGGPAA